MEDSSDDLVKAREADMVSPFGGTPLRRTALFLKPSLKPFENSARYLLPSTLFSEPISDLEKLPLQATFKGWSNTLEEWKTWEEQLRCKHEHTWRSAGIHEAIKASTYQIHKNRNLILGLAQKWYSKTNSFIFSWGEATITLEDIMECGGYSVLGSPVFTPLEDEESKEIEDKLDQVRRKLARSKAKKANHIPWMRHFMEEKGELEHVAFLSLWLARFVFTFPNIIPKLVFPIAIHLARGIQIALAPAVLASIYRDLRLLKNHIDHATKSGATKDDDEDNDDDDDNNDEAIALKAPFILVQIWAFERFPTLHTNPNQPEYNQPRMAKWVQVKMLEVDNISSTLETCRESFIWRPYVNFPKSYNEKDERVCFSSGSHNDLESFAYCLRHSELVGIELDHYYIEKYLPHRVCMQFGLDQDIPGRLAHHHKEISYRIAWKNYNKPLTSAMLCAAAAASSSVLKPSVTVNYLEWWKQSKLGLWENKPSKNSEPLSPHSDQVWDSEEEDGLTISEILRSHSQRHIGNEVTDSVVSPNVAAHNIDTSMAEGVENLDGELKRDREDAESDEEVNVMSKCKRAKRGQNGDNAKQGEEDVSTGTICIDSYDLETRIGKLEEVIAKLKAAKFGSKSKKFGASFGLS